MALDDRFFDAFADLTDSVIGRAGEFDYGCARHNTLAKHLRNWESKPNDDQNRAAVEALRSRLATPEKAALYHCKVAFVLDIAECGECNEYFKTACRVLWKFKEGCGEIQKASLPIELRDAAGPR